MELKTRPTDEPDRKYGEPFSIWCDTRRIDRRLFVACPSRTRRPNQFYYTIRYIHVYDRNCGHSLLAIDTLINYYKDENNENIPKYETIFGCSRLFLAVYF